MSLNLRTNRVIIIVSFLLFAKIHICRQYVAVPCTLQTHALIYIHTYFIQSFECFCAKLYNNKDTIIPFKKNSPEEFHMSEMQCVRNIFV